MRTVSLLCFLCCVCFAPTIAQAHFGMIIPSRPTVMEAGDAALSLSLKFWHPFENVGMDLEKPASFSVYQGGKATDLLGSLKGGDERGSRVWISAFTVQRPGLHVFVMEPKPYFEKEEDCFIVHLTKVYVDAYGDDEGWSEPVGLKTEIVPLVRPGALYAGNVFQGRVLREGKPVPGAEVEVEWYPGPDKKGAAPYDSMVTQTVKADEAGIFSYAAPAAGWWGFAALQDGGANIPHKGEEKPVELGAVVWVYFHAMMPAVQLP